MTYFTNEKTNFADALFGDTNTAYTENAAVARRTTGSEVLNFFSVGGALRSRSEDEIVRLFSNAWAEDRELALKALFYFRDVRGGQGERRSFRVFLSWLAKNRPQLVKKNINLILEYGRADDLFTLFGTRLEKDTLKLIKRELLENRNGLVAKWMPREKKRNSEYIGKICKALKTNKKTYRKILVELSDTVEQKMCDHLHYPSIDLFNTGFSVYNHKIKIARNFLYNIPEKVVYLAIAAVCLRSSNCQKSKVFSFFERFKNFVIKPLQKFLFACFLTTLYSSNKIVSDIVHCFCYFDT